MIAIERVLHCGHEPHEWMRGEEIDPQESFARMFHDGYEVCGVCCGVTKEQFLHGLGGDCPRDGKHTTTHFESGGEGYAGGMDRDGLAWLGGLACGVVLGVAGAVAFWLVGLT